MGKLKIFPISIRISERDLSVFTGVLPLTTIFFWVVTAQQPTQRNHNLIRHEFCINLIAKVEPLVNGGPPKKVQDFRRQNLPTGSEN